jgi:steroid delta-isomerase-like uncharacterized protein
MSAKNNKTIILSVIDALNGGDIDKAVEIDAPDVLLNGEPFGLEADRQRCIMMANAFPDGQWIVDDAIAEDDKVVLRYTFRGTNQGDLRGIPATGKTVSFSGMSIYRMVDGKCVEFWEALDRLALYQQLGLVPA